MSKLPLLIPACLAFSVALLAQADDRGGEEHPKRKEVVAFAKSLDVKQLDSSLPSERLEHFLDRVLPKESNIKWGSSDCENKPPSFPRPPDTPLCASIHANVYGRALRFEIVVGTHSTPISGQPHIEKLYLLGSPPGTRAQPAVQTLKSLAELPHVSKRSKRAGAG